MYLPNIVWWDKNKENQKKKKQQQQLAQWSSQRNWI